MAVLAALGLSLGACSGGTAPVQADARSEADDLGRSSGSLDESAETEDDGQAEVGSGTDSEGSGTDGGPAGDDPIVGSGSEQDGTPDPGSGSEADENDALDPETSVPEPIIRADGLELVFAEGSLGPARLGSTIDEMAAALGPAYEITAEEAIRVGFQAGYSVARGGQVLFWAIEEDGEITVLMTNNPRVGLDSGLRPGMSLADAIALHGEPSLSIGPEVREFASFEDGTGGGPLSVLVAIGQFGGPVGIYQSLELGAETVEYELEEANIKELWFWNR